MIITINPLLLSIKEKETEDLPLSFEWLQQFLSILCTAFKSLSNIQAHHTQLCIFTWSFILLYGPAIITGLGGSILLKLKHTSTIKLLIIDKLSRKKKCAMLSCLTFILWSIYCTRGSLTQRISTVAFVVVLEHSVRTIIWFVGWIMLKRFLRIAFNVQHLLDAGVTNSPIMSVSGSCLIALSYLYQAET